MAIAGSARKRRVGTELGLQTASLTSIAALAVDALIRVAG
jgi:hypothetical protein